MFAKFYIFSLVFSCLLLLCSSEMGEGNILIHYNFQLEEFPYEGWQFGPRIPMRGIEGVIFNADPPDACLPINEPPKVNFSLSPFVLIAGNSCDYDTKVLHAQLAGYSVAIIYEMKENTANASKQHWDYVPNIPVISITESSACIIQNNFLYSIDKSLRAFLKYSDSQYLDLFLFMIFCGGIAFILVILLKNLKLLRSWCNRGEFSYSLLHLQVLLYQKGDPYESCAICLQDFKMKEKLRILPCFHGYHLKCIDRWILQHQRTCPVCKQSIYQAFETTPLIRKQQPPQFLI